TLQAWPIFAQLCGSGLGLLNKAFSTSTSTSDHFTAGRHLHQCDTPYDVPRIMPRVLDPSPVILQHAPVAPRRPLKRTASIASLPTPPRSGDTKKRQRKEVPSGEDVEEGSESSLSEYEERPISKLVFKSKTKTKGKTVTTTVTKTIVVDLEAEKAAEDLFWLGGSADKKEGGPSTELKDKEKRKASSTTGSLPPSPPLSPVKETRSKVQIPRPALKRTATASSSDGELLPNPDGDEDGPIRDSPRNVFLVKKKGEDPPKPTQDEDEEEELEEAPTVSYVFRGKRQEFPNPLYNLPSEAYDRAKLPTSHPEFSPLPTVKRTRLFAKELDEKDVKDKKRRRRHSASPASSPSSSPSRPKRKATTIKKPRHTPQNTPLPPTLIMNLATLEDIVTAATTIPDQGVLAQGLKSFLKRDVAEAILASSLPNNEDPLAVLDPRSNTIGYIYILYVIRVLLSMASARLEQSGSGPGLVTQILNFCENFQSNALAYVPERVNVFVMRLLSQPN
ncbi:16695_t:CDS:2, partial [Acaulospora colombiana]